MNKKILYILIPLLVAVVAFNLLNAGGNSPQSSSACVMESKKFAEADKSKAVILDVRTPAEYNSGHVQGARSMDIYSKNFTEEINKLDKDQTYYVYCKTGIRSRNAAGYMRQAGFKNVCEIQGGILSLARTGVTLVK